MRPEHTPPPPSAPDPDMCCRRGCSPCLFDYYDAAFSEWEAGIRDMGIAPDSLLAALGQKRARRPY